MERQLDPTHSEARKAIERIKRSIAKAIFGAAEGLDPRDEVIEEEEPSSS